MDALRVDRVSLKVLLVREQLLISRLNARLYSLCYQAPSMPRIRDVEPCIAIRFHRLPSKSLQTTLDHLHTGYASREGLLRR